MADSRDDEVPEVKAETSDTSERQKDFTRRALLRAGWVVPAVTAINIPSASAQTPAPHNDIHGDSAHVDNIHSHRRPSGYGDRPARGPHRPRRRPACGHAAAHRRSAFRRAAHRRAAHRTRRRTPTIAAHRHRTDVPTPHTDVPHTDTPPHTDVPHTDTPPHTDVPHTDTPPHTDVPHTDTPPHTDVPHSTRRPCGCGDASRQSWRHPRRSWRSHRRAWR